MSWTIFLTYSIKFFMPITSKKLNSLVTQHNCRMIRKTNIVISSLKCSHKLDNFVCAYICLLIRKFLILSSNSFLGIFVINIVVLKEAHLYVNMGTMEYVPHCHLMAFPMKIMKPILRNIMLVSQ